MVQTTPKHPNKMVTRSINTTNTKSYSQNTSPSKKKPKIKVDESKTQQPTTPSAASVTNKDNTDSNGYVCTICKNSDSIRDARIKLETELLTKQVAKFDEIKTTLSDSASQIESLDLHIQHLLLDRKRFDDYQNRIEQIDKNCDNILCDIAALNNNTNSEPIPISTGISESDISDICNKINDSIDSKLGKNNEIITDKIGKLNSKLSKLTPIDVISEQCVDNNVISEKFKCDLENLNELTTSNTKTLNDIKSIISDSEIPYKLSSAQGGLAQNNITTSPYIKDPTPICEPYVKYTENVISAELREKLQTFVTDNENKFCTIGDCREVLYFGEYGYRYSGTYHKPCETPEVIQDLLDSVRPQLSNQSEWMNSCLINRYSNGTQFIPPHRDDEAYIDPESEIITVSIGCTRSMKFVDNMSTVNKELPLTDSSVLITNRFAQDFWKHGIDHDDSITEARYSFTFRHLSPSFANSTVIIGDSNTRYLKFGAEQGKFGHRMPGKSIPAMHIEEIPRPELIGPYRKVVIHTGINNLKSRNRKSNKTLIDELESKCDDILNMYPRCKIYLSMLLPTKLNSLNYIIREYNNRLVDMAYSHRNIHLIDHPDFSGDEGHLKDALGRFIDGKPNATDIVHLGMKGIRLFAVQIKECILKRPSFNKRNNNTSAAVSSPGNHHRDGYQPPNRDGV